MTLDILDIIELRSQWVVDIDDNDLPVSLLFVEQSHHTENLDLLDLTWVSDQLADLADVQWVVVSLGLGLRVDNIGIFPSLCCGQQVRRCLYGVRGCYLREGTIVPEVTLVGEAVAHETEFALLDVLLDRVEEPRET